MTRITERIAWTIAGALGIAVVALVAGVVSAGPLTPPGPPSPTQETLIHQPSSCAGFPITLSNSGSYRLAGNISVGTCGTDGIVLNTSGITLDLSGFELFPGSSGLRAIGTTGGWGNTTIRNGRIAAGWASGGVVLPNEDGIRIESIFVTQTGGVGIHVDDRAQISGCQSSFNASQGIIVGEDSTISNCTSVTNGNNGIEASSLGRVLVSDCIAAFNAGAGITVGDNSVVDGCIAINNTTGIAIGIASKAVNCTAANNSGNGIFSNGAGGVIENCTARANGLDGIMALLSCEVIDNVSEGNGVAGTGAGVHIAGGANCRVEGNTVISNDMGIDVDTAGHTIFNNTARNNGAAGLANEYTDIVGGNDVGPVGTAASATSPWANIAY